MELASTLAEKAPTEAVSFYVASHAGQVVEGRRIIAATLAQANDPRLSIKHINERCVIKKPPDWYTDMVAEQLPCFGPEGVCLLRPKGLDGGGTRGANW